MKLGQRLGLIVIPFTLSGCFLLDNRPPDDTDRPFPSEEADVPPQPPPGGPNGSVFGGGSLGVQPQRLAELRTSEAEARPLSGGTLAVSADGSTALVADPDRDCVYVVRPGDVSSKKVQLPAGSEPGRVLLGAGAGHVVLRGSGKLVRIDLSAASVAAEAAPCAQPRGVAYDQTQDALVVACMDGQLVSLGATDYQEISRSYVAQDLRDVIVTSSGRTFVSRYRSAELLSLGFEGNVRATTRPKQAHGTRFEAGLPVDTRGGGDLAPIGLRDVTFSPALAWRALSSADDRLWMLHQESQDGEVAISQGGYGSGCAPITQGAVTRFGSDGAPQASMPIATLGLSVDVAISVDARWVAVASPGAYLQGGATLQLYSTSSMVSEISADACTGSTLIGGDRSQVVAVSFDASGLVYTFSREPAELEVYKIGSTDSVSLTRLATIGLDRRSVRDTGHELFHTDVGSGLSCASCHGEALDDGHVWTFRGFGARRTQNIRGGLLGTAPFHWDGDMSDFKQLVDDVMTGRMGGFPVNDEYAGALGEWIDKQPALCLPASDAAAAARGKALFDASETACASCHSGDALTNNQSADVGTGRVLQVPSLRGLGLRAPYMHDGCAKTLEARFEPDCGGGDKHGRTSQLTNAQIADLTAYLRTL